MLVSVLEVVLHGLLPNHLLNLALRLDVEGVLVQQSHLFLTIALPLLILTYHLQPDLTETVAVVDRFSKRRPLLPHLCHSSRVAQDTQPCSLNLLHALLWPLTLATTSRVTCLSSLL